MSSNNKVKGVLKGLRYISQIFENEKETEMQIGFPTDVKHVAHVGCDGPSVNSSGWMNEFKIPENGGDFKEDGSIKSEDSSSRISAKDLDLPKTSRRHGPSTGSSSAEEPTRKRTEKSRLRRLKQSNKDLSESTISKNIDEAVGGRGSELPKKSRRKKSKDYGDTSSRTSRREKTSKSECASVSNNNSNNNNNNNDDSETSSVNPPGRRGEEKERIEFSW